MKGAFPEGEATADAPTDVAPADDAVRASGRSAVAVAVSGGRDSIALLHSTLRHATELGLRVVALHVNHGLLPEADGWQRDLQRRCAEWARRGAPLRLVCERLATRPQPGDSVEAWARRARYAALRRMALAAGCDTVLLAHHRRDQAETFLLQALRGGGVAGIAGMPTAALRDGVHWLRPWLAQPREAIDAYVRRHRLRVADDPSNADPRWARNRLRTQVWPALTQAFPQAEQVLGDAARWAGLATQALQELAELDLAQVADDAGLLLAPWQALSPARRQHALRAWLHRQAGRAAPASLVERLMAELPAAPQDATPVGARRWTWADGRLAVHRGRLVMLVPSAEAPAPAERPRPTLHLSIDGPGRYPLTPWGGELLVEAVTTDGVPLARLASVDACDRTGREQFQAGPRRPPRSLKKQFQAADVPAWAREGPLLYGDDGRLIFVAGLGVDARAVVDHGDTLVSLTWLPAAAA